MGRWAQARRRGGGTAHACPALPAMDADDVEILEDPPTRFSVSAFTADRAADTWQVRYTVDSDPPIELAVLPLNEAAVIGPVVFLDTLLIEGRYLLTGCPDGAYGQIGLFDA